MANGTSIFDFSSETLAIFLAKSATGGTLDDVFTTLKTDTDAASAVQIPENGGQLWSNGMDDYLQATYSFFYRKTAVWGQITQAALQALGSDDGIAVNDLGWASTEQAQYYCASIDGATTSTWTMVPAAGLTRQAAFNGGGAVVTVGAYSTTGPGAVTMTSSGGTCTLGGTAVGITASTGNAVITATVDDVQLFAGTNVAIAALGGDFIINASGDVNITGTTATVLDTPILAWGSEGASVTWTDTVGKPNEAQPTGSFKIVTGASVGQVWVKTGTVNTDWELTNGGLSVPAFAVAGDLEVGARPFRFRSRVAGTIVRVQITVGTAPTDASILVDVNVGGSTIFSTQGNRPAILTTATEGNTTTINSPTVAVNDEFTIEIDQIGSTIAGADLLVEIEIAVNQ